MFTILYKINSTYKDAFLRPWRARLQCTIISRKTALTRNKPKNDYLDVVFITECINKFSGN